MSLCLALLGPSGVGKSTVLEYCRRRAGAESAPKYTTRPSRATTEDEANFIFVAPSEVPNVALMTFESYGHQFGIQTERIEESLAAKRPHVLTVGGATEVARLREKFPGQCVAILVYCRLSVLRERIERSGEPQRVERWPSIERECAQLYDELWGVDMVVDNSGSFVDTQRAIDRILRFVGLAVV